MAEKSHKPIARRAFLMGSAGGVLAAGSGTFAPLLGLGPPAQWREDERFCSLR
jgi:hypothetical protein